MSLYRYLSLLVFTAFVLGGYLFYSEKEYKQVGKYFEEFKQKSENYLFLKKKWISKENKEKILNSMRTRFKPVVYKKEGNRVVIEFKTLDERSFGRVGDMFLNNGFVIKKFDIKKQSETLFFHIEVEI